MTDTTPAMRSAQAVLVEVSVHRFIRSLTFSAFLAVSAGASAKAQDAEFGCKVLLCAAATNPSWPSIPYCVLSGRRPLVKGVSEVAARLSGAVMSSAFVRGLDPLALMFVRCSSGPDHRIALA
jgi:hypothetical protein